jgi:predicted RNA methylase
MIKDEVRVDAYRKALSALAKDKVVVDVGTGTGLLATLALDCGASYVYAIEASNIAIEAQEKFSQRPYRGKISLHRCMAENYKLGRIKADLIVSEWMGYFLLYENMLPSVFAVRDKVLKKDGEIIPREATLVISGYLKNDTLTSK